MRSLFYFIKKQKKYFHFSLYISFRLVSKKWLRQLPALTLVLFFQETSASFFRERKGNLNQSHEVQCNPHFTTVMYQWWKKKDLTSLKLHKLFSETTTSNKPLPADKWKDARHFNPTNPAAEGWAVSVNSIYCYTDESDMLIPGCNMLFCNFY